MRNYLLTLDIYKQLLVPFLQVSQADLNSNTFVITINENDVVCDLTDHTIKAFIKTRSGSFEHPVSILDNKVNLKLNDRAVAEPSLCTVEIHVIKNGERLALMQFKYNVTKSISSYFNQPSEDVPLWQQVYNKIDGAIEEVNTQTDIKKQELLDYNDSILEPISAQESARVTAESNRVNAENTRVTQENTRKSQETSRVSAESNRVIAESNRATAESNRATDEATRNTKESERQDAELKRQVLKVELENLKAQLTIIQDSINAASKDKFENFIWDESKNELTKQVAVDGALSLRYLRNGVWVEL